MIRRLRIPALAAAALVVGLLAAAPGAEGVSLSSGQAAIQRFSARVGRLTQASSYRLRRCSTSGSGVTCQVSWAYKAKDTYYDSNTDTWKTRRRVVMACGVKALAYSAGGALKVKSASRISCRTFD